MLNGNQKAIRLEMARNSISALDKNSSLVDRIVSGAEKWCFFILSAIRKNIVNLETARRRFQSADEVKYASQAELEDKAKN
ncbi:hypothetical protein TNCV_1881851 [Trichonephila clavipes]|nr:hypothetical protein TNCV_1881851 [Trichonephila clavipes]